MKEFKTSDEFFNWFLGEIESFAPNYKELVANASEASRQGVDNHAIIVQSLPTLSSQQMGEMFSSIREIVYENKYIGS